MPYFKTRLYFIQFRITEIEIWWKHATITKKSKYTLLSQIGNNLVSESHSPPDHYFIREYSFAPAVLTLASRKTNNIRYSFPRHLACACAFGKFENEPRHIRHSVRSALSRALSPQFLFILKRSRAHAQASFRSSLLKAHRAASK